MSVDPDTFRATLGRFASGVTIITARDADGRDHGMTVSAFSSLSLEPPLVLACVDHAASMHRVLMTARGIGVSILAEGQHGLSRRFAEADADRFDGVGQLRGANGAVLFPGAVAHLECTVRERHEAGDHTILVCAVDRAATFDTRPLLYFRGEYALLGG